MKKLSADYLEVRQPGEIVEYYGAGRRRTIYPSDPRAKAAIAALTEDDRLLFFARGLRSSGDRPIAASIQWTRVESPEFANHAACAVLECERHNDFGGLHHQATLQFSDTCPSDTDGYFLPSGKKTKDRSAAIAAWANVYEIETQNRDGETIAYLAYTPA